jgi:hypothetical protein
VSQAFGARYGIALGAAAALLAGAWGMTKVKRMVKPADVEVEEPDLTEAAAYAAIESERA